MKASELMSELQKIIAEYGDLNVTVPYDAENGYSWYNAIDLETIEVHQDDGYIFFR